MVRFLRRRACSQGQALTFRGRCRNLRCTEPRAASSDYGDLVEVVAAALSTRHGRIGGESARQGQVGRLRAARFARERFYWLDRTRKLQRCAGWSTAGRGHRCGGVLGSRQAERSRGARRYKASSLRTRYGRESGPSNVSMIFMRPPQQGHGGGSWSETPGPLSSSLSRCIGADGTSSRV